MPVIPSFSAYAAKPQLAESWLRGVQLAQEAQNNAARISLGYAQIQAERERSQNQLATQLEIATTKALADAHRAEVQQAYRDINIGLKERQLSTMESAQKRLADEAAREFDRQQKYNRLQAQYAKEAIAKGETPEQAAQTGARRALLETGGTGVATAMTPPHEPSQIPELRFKLQQLADEERNVYRLEPRAKYGRISPEGQAKLEDIQRRRQLLEVPAGLEKPRGTSTNLIWNESKGDFD